MHGSAALTAGSVTVHVSATNNTVPLTVRMCADAAGEPNLGSCQSFTNGSAILGALSNIQYSGTYPMLANFDHWVVLSTTGAGDYAWGTYTSGAVDWAVTNNQGTTWTPFNNTTNLLYAVAAAPAAGASVAGVPTLSQWAMLLMSGLMALGGFLTLRRAQPDAHWRA
jgi:hypothetical protein